VEAALELHKAIEVASGNHSEQAKKDAQQIIIGIITAHENEQLVELSNVYVSTHNFPALPEDIKKAAPGEYGTFLVDLLIPRPQFAARTIQNAITGAGTDEKAIIDVIVHTPQHEIQAIRSAYSQIFSRDLDTKIQSDLSGNFGKAVNALLHRGQAESIGDPESEADELYKKGEGKWGTDDAFFVQFFTRHSFSSLQDVNRAYTAKYNHSLEVAIKKETSGNYQDLLVALVISREEYWARRIRHAIAGLGTNDTLLRRAFSLNSKAQLQKIAAVYPEVNKGKDLALDVADDTSGYYKDVFLGLLNN